VLTLHLAVVAAYDESVRVEADVRGRNLGHSMLEICKNILKILSFAIPKAAELELGRTSRRGKIL